MCMTMSQKKYKECYYEIDEESLDKQRKKPSQKKKHILREIERGIDEYEHRD